MNFQINKINARQLLSEIHDQEDKGYEAKTIVENIKSRLALIVSGIGFDKNFTRSEDIKT